MSDEIEDLTEAAAEVVKKRGWVGVVIAGLTALGAVGGISFVTDPIDAFVAWVSKGSVIAAESRYTKHMTKQALFYSASDNAYMCAVKEIKRLGGDEDACTDTLDRGMKHANDYDTSEGVSSETTEN